MALLFAQLKLETLGENLVNNYLLKQNVMLLQLEWSGKWSDKDSSWNDIS